MAEDPIKMDDKEVRLMIDSADFFFHNMKFYLTRVALYAKARILRRTSKGVDYKGKAFASYTENYALFRQKKGRPTDKVDLFFRGRMLGSMSVKATNKFAVLFFSGRKQALKASGLNYGNSKIPKRREFFALSAEDLAGINAMALEELDRVF